MSRIIWAILGVILAIWVASMAIGGISALLSTFLTIGLVAVAIAIAVRLLAKRSGSG